MQSRWDFHILQFLDLYIIRCFDGYEMYRRIGQCGIENLWEPEVAIVVYLAKTVIRVSY
jgi:hypothetical protein